MASNSWRQPVRRVRGRTSRRIRAIPVRPIPVGPANTEGGIACSKDAVWMATGADGDKVARIDPKKNAVTAEVEVPA